MQRTNPNARPPAPSPARARRTPVSKGPPPAAGLVPLAACGLLFAACSAGGDDTGVRDVPRETDAEAEASICGPGGECSDPYLTCCPIVGCVDLHDDLFNCGECDNECALDEECQSGVCFTPECFPECDPRQICCGGECLDPMSNNDKCGRCGNTCDAPMRCLGGACMCDAGIGADMCNPGETCCATGCVDVLTDSGNCGACGNSCGALPCNAGQCSCGPTVCPVGQACCDSEEGICADLLWDVDHCGSCTNACDPDRSTGCVEGACLCPDEPQCASGTVTYPLCQMSPMMPPHRCCADGCERIDDWSCARCGQVCSGGTECQASAGFFDCNFACEVPE